MAETQERMIEYIAISVGGGAVYSISPTSPQTETACKPGQNPDIGNVVAKLAEYGYKLISGVIPTGEVHPAGANYVVFMVRET